MRYLLDSNVLSEPARPQPRPKIITWLEENITQSATASVVWHELRFGALRLPKSKKRYGLLRYLKEILEPRLAVLPYDQDAADWHAQERTRLAALGRTPLAADAQIAAVAATRGLSLVTLNGADYAHFKSLQIISPLEA